MGQALPVDRPSQPLLKQKTTSQSTDSTSKQLRKPRRRLLISKARRSRHRRSSHKSLSNNDFVLFDELPKDVFVYSLRYLPSQDHCKLARTNHIFADGSRAARALYKGLRINSLRPPAPSVYQTYRRHRGSDIVHVARRAMTAVFGRARSNSVVGPTATGVAGAAPTTTTPQTGGGTTAAGADNSTGGGLPFLRLFRRANGGPTPASGRSLSAPYNAAGGTTRAAIRALSSGAFKNLRMLSFPHDFDVHAYNLSYHELASIFNGCQTLKLVSSLPGGVLSFVTTPLPALREISVISGTPSDMHALFRHAPQLTWLSFSPILSSACEALLRRIPDELPRLKTLELICIRLTRHGLLRNLRKLEDLEMLSLQQVGVDDIDLRAMSQGGHPKLKVLVILGNPQVSYDGLRHLHRNLEALKVLDVRQSLNHC